MNSNKPSLLQRLFQMVFPKFFAGHANEQAKLVLLAALPCYLIALLALSYTYISGYLIIFIAIILLLLIIYAALSGKQRANYQIQTLANLVEAMIDGDYTLRGRQQNNPAFHDLLSLVNNLADTLQKHKIKAEESQLLLEKVMDQMDAMVFAVGPNNHLALMNASAKKLLLANYDEEKPSQEIPLITLADIGLSSLQDYSESGVIELSTENFSGEYFLFKDQFISNNDRHELYLLTRADRLLREKEREAWQNLLRVLSHEINNSLTPIATFSRTMLKKLTRLNSPDANQKEAIQRAPGQLTETLQSFTQGLSIIQERAESLHGFVASYSKLSHLPAADKRLFHWREKLTQLSSLITGCQIKNCLVDKPELDFEVYADPQQLEQVFINLLKNAQEAMADKESGENIKIEKEIKLDAFIENNQLNIIIADRGTGIINSDNIFVPFYTTKATGSGIGLTLCRQILVNHNGNLKLRNRLDENGAEVIVTLPVIKQ